MTDEELYEQARFDATMKIIERKVRANRERRVREILGEPEVLDHDGRMHELARERATSCCNYYYGWTGLEKDQFKEFIETTGSADEYVNICRTQQLHLTLHKSPYKPYEGVDHE